ncbi:MAG TPA: hypothetical protein VJ032_07520 [Thermoanaerobaculia bacterium]|nr:hypothetical protein [Thermoanaerobaculia bacterium]
MFKLKNWGIAAALALTTAGAMASNFRAADQVYLPIGGHIQGGNALFVSDVFISNLSTDTVTVSVIFSSGTNTGNAAPQTSFAPITLGPLERRELLDFFGNNLGITNGLGMVIFNACKQGADCSAATQDASGFSPNFRNISVESRIYSTISGVNGTTGQDIAGMPWYSFVTMDQAATGLDRVFITGIRNTPQYRTNIGIVNASQYSRDMQIRLTLFSSTGAVLGTTTRTLGPLGQEQQSVGNLFGAAFPTAVTSTGAWVQVEQVASNPTADAPQGCTTTGCPAFFAYGSQLDNATGDPTTLESQYFKPLTDAQILAIYPTTAGKSAVRRVARH